MTADSTWAVSSSLAAVTSPSRTKLDPPDCVNRRIAEASSERRISLNALTEQRDWLLGEIDRVGYVAIAVRPGGWTRDSFETAKGLIQEHIESQRLNHGRVIAHTDFPLHADEAIGPYLPPPAS